MQTVITAIRNAIRDIPDFPKPGIVFKDIAPVLGDAALFRQVIDLLAARHRGQTLQRIAAVDARGFLLAGALADRLNAGIIPIRKAGKLPYQTRKADYALEYGTATLEMHVDACAPGDSVLLVDDLLATGGTAVAAISLLEQAGATVVGVDFLIELAFLNGRKRLAGYDVFAPVVF